MKVLFCSYQAVANPGGGVYTQVIMTCKYLREAGVDVELFDSWKRYDWKEIDVVHVFETDMRNYFLLKMIPSDVPLVVSPIIDKTYPPFVARVLTAFSAPLPPQVLTSYKSHALAFRKADVVISRSSDERRMLEKGFGVPAVKIRDVPNGVEEKFLEASPEVFRSKYGLDGFVLYVGQIGNPRKNLFRLLRVAKEMKDIPFVLIGPTLETGYARKVLKMAAELDNVHVLGRLPEEELISAYAACDVFVLPSLVEGTGLVALEAGLAGAKVVVTKYGGPPDYFGNFAVYVEPKSETSIKEGIEQSLEKPKDDSLRNHIKSRFLWSNVADRLIDIYNEVIG